MRAVAVRTRDARRARFPLRGLVFVTTALSLTASCRHDPEPSVGDAPGQLAAPAPDPEAGVPPEMVGTSWRLVRLDGRELDPELPEVTLSFESARASGSGGCNWYTGWLEEAAFGRLVVSHLAVTRRSCVHPRIMDRESRYLAALEGSKTYRLDGDRLVLTGTTTGSLEFRRERSPRPE